MFFGAASIVFAEYGQRAGGTSKCIDLLLEVIALREKGVL